MMSLHISLLGGFRAWLAPDAPIDIQSKKAQALLAYLALHPGKVISREKLTALLWGGSSDEQARHSLSQALFGLKKVLAGAADCLLTNGKTVTLDPVKVEVDVHSLESAVANATAESLEQAVTLYKGDLLEGINVSEPPFEEWLLVERERLRELTLDALSKLLEMQRDANDVERAIQTALQLLALDPMRESVHRALMELYARQGRRAAVLSQYRRCVKILQQDLGVEPEPATVALYKEIVGRTFSEPRQVEGHRAPDRAATVGVAKVPKTRYTKSGDVNIAYQVIGSGPPDLVLVPGWISNVEIFWEQPRVARFFERLASFSRLILLDKRGTGLSDRVPLEALPTLEQQMEDLRRVMDAAGCERAVLVGYSESGPMCAMFAATYPERTAALVMINSFAGGMKGPDFPWGISADDQARLIQAIRQNWGGPIGVKFWAPSMADDPMYRDWWARFLRMSASPSAAEVLAGICPAIDARHVLTAITVPTLVLHAVGDKVLDVHLGRDIAARIPHAQYIELPGTDHDPWLSDADAIVEEIQRFITAAQPGVQEPDRLLVTMLCVELMRGEPSGNGPGAQNGTRYNELARLEIVRFRGRLLEAEGGTVLAAFDGPARATHCAYAVVEKARGVGISTRAGLHTGECEVWHDGLRGAAVETVRRVVASAEAGQVVASGTVKDLVALSGIEFEATGQEQSQPPLYRVTSMITEHARE